MSDPDYTREDFERHCERFGFKPSDYGRPFDWFEGDAMHEIVGFNPRARRYPVIARRTSDGRLFTYRAEDVHASIANGGIAWNPEVRND